MSTSELLNRLELCESVARYAFEYKAKNGKWYLELTHDEYDYERRNATTYGPFDSQDSLNKYLRGNHSNPGGGSVDNSGKKKVPKKSPNGSPVIDPRKDRWTRRWP